MLGVRSCLDISMRRSLVIFLCMVALLLVTGRRHAGSQASTVKSLLQEHSADVLPLMLAQYGIVGTGAVVERGDGYSVILTNNHVCRALFGQDTRPFTVLDSRQEELTLVKKLYKTDLCMLTTRSLNKFRREGFKLSLVTPGYGDWLLVVGHPNNQPQTPSEGYYVAEVDTDMADAPVAGVCEDGAPITDSSMGPVCGHEMHLAQVTNLVYPGNSGSPIMDVAGHLVGIVNSTNSFTYHGNFIPADDVEDFLTSK